MVLSHLLSLEQKLSQPSPDFFPDTELRQELQTRNQWQIRFYTLLLLTFTSLSGSINLDYEAKFFILGYIFLHGGSCLLFCRTRISIYYWIYTISSSLMELILVMYMKEIIIYALMVCFVSPIFVLTITHNLTYVGFTVLSQLVLIHWKYKYILAEFLGEISSEDFSSRFMNAASFILFAITLLYSLLFISLTKTNKELKESKHKAESACSQLEIFIQTFSHELRNPLNSLLGNIQMVLQEKLYPRVAEMVESAQICGDLLLQLINNILDTGRIHMGILEVSPSANNSSEIIGTVWRISRDLIRKKNLNGYLTIDKDLPPVLHIDFYRLHQILLNLVGNAIKFTTKGSISISVKWIPKAIMSERCFMPQPYDEEGVFEKTENFKALNPNYEDEDYYLYVNSNWIDLSALKLRCFEPNTPGILKVIVKDTGCGIKKEDIPSVFGKYTQFHKDPTQRKLGTGLGLYITKEICEKMNGQIRVYSKENVGTAFIVCIPTHCPKLCQQNMDPRDTIYSLKRDKLNVLLVDDNPFNIDLLDNYMKKIDGRVVGKAQNGSDGLQKYIQCRQQYIAIDVVFLDIDMPIMNGKTLCSKIREFEIRNGFNSVKIVFSSGNYEESQTRELFDQTGVHRADGFLKKPVSFETFMKVVRESTR